MTYFISDTLEALISLTIVWLACAVSNNTTLLLRGYVAITIDSYVATAAAAAAIAFEQTHEVGSLSWLTYVAV